MKLPEGVILARVVLGISERYTLKSQKNSLEFNRLKEFARRYQNNTPITYDSEDEKNKAKRILDDFCKEYQVYVEEAK